VYVVGEEVDGFLVRCVVVEYDVVVGVDEVGCEGVVLGVDDDVSGRDLFC